MFFFLPTNDGHIEKKKKKSERYFFFHLIFVRIIIIPITYTISTKHYTDVKQTDSVIRDTFIDSKIKNFLNNLKYD